jgi:hypothetical protein
VNTDGKQQDWRYVIEVVRFLKTTHIQEASKPALQTPVIPQFWDTSRLYIIAAMEWNVKSRISTLQPFTQTIGYNDNLYPHIQCNASEKERTYYLPQNCNFLTCTHLPWHQQNT